MALSVRRGERTIAELPSDQRAPVRRLMRNTTDAQMLKHANAQREAKPRQVGQVTRTRRASSGA